MASEDSDKTEEPTEHKLQEGRKKGQVMKSQEVVSFIMLLATAGVLVMTGPWSVRELVKYATTLYWRMPSITLDERNITLLFLGMLAIFAKMLLPLLGVAFFAGVLGNLLQTGFLFSTTPLTPTWEKISPVAGFKRIFSVRALMELAKQLAKLVIVGYVAYKIVKNSMEFLTQTPLWDLNHILIFTYKIIFKIIWYVAAASVVIAVVDFLFQKKQFLKQMKMSFQELKDEYKDTEGDPYVKAKMRSLQRHAAQARMMENVPDSTAVITNPVHLAVAVKYEQGVQEAPLVTAKGERLVAQRIKEIAEEHDVTIVENVALARALFQSCEVGESIPVDLYKATAEVLAFVYKLKKKRVHLRRIQRKQGGARRAGQSARSGASQKVRAR